MATCSDDLDLGPVQGQWNEKFNSWGQIAESAVQETNTVTEAIARTFGRTSTNVRINYTGIGNLSATKLTLPTFNTTLPAYVKPDPITKEAINLPGPIDPPTTVLPEQPTPLPINPVDKPPPIDVDIPDDPPQTIDPDMPPDLELDIPVAPGLRTITIPDVPVLEFPEFDELAPVFEGAPELEAFYYQEPEYESPIRQELIDKILEWLLGGTGLPEWIWQRIWDRARTNEVETGLAAIQQADTDAASRGFSLPPGIRNKRVQEAETKLLEESNRLNREVAIKRAEMEVDNIRFALEKGIQLEGLFIQEFQEYARRTLEAAKYAVDAAVSVYNVFVSVYNARVAAYRMAIEVNQILIQQELAKLEAYRGELEGKRIIGELNRLDVEIYTQQNQALIAQVQLYNAQLEAVQKEINVYVAEVDAFKSRVEAAGISVDAQAKLFDAYETEVNAEKAKADMYTAQVAGYAGVIDAYSAEVDAQVAEKKLLVDSEELKIRATAADIGRYNAEVQANLGVIQASLDNIQAQVAAYTAKVSAEEANARIALENGRIKVLDAKNRADIDVAEAQLILEHFRGTMQLSATAQLGVAQTQAQIANSALSAINLSASYQIGQTMSHQFSKTDCP